MKTYLRILRYVHPYWRRVALSILCTVLYSIFNGLSIYLFIPLLEMLFHSDKIMSMPSASGALNLPFGIASAGEQVKQTIVGFIFGGTEMEALMKICLIILGAFLFKNIFGYLQSYFMNYVEEAVVKDVRDALYRHLHNLPLGYFTNERTGGLIARITSDVSLINGGVSAFFITLIREPLSIVVFLALAFSISWKLTVISLFVFPVAMSVIGALALRLHRERGTSQERLADITSILQETISGVKVVKAFGMEDFETRKFMAQTRRYFQSLMKITRMREVASPLTEVMTVIAGVIIIWYGGTQILVDRSIDASQFLGFLLIIFQIMSPIKELTSVNNRIQESSAAGKRVFEILDTRPSIGNAPHAACVEEFNDNIEFDHVHFRYHGSEPILRDVSMVIHKGEIAAIVGPSGSGKTTLVDLIPRFYDPTEGRILIDGVDITSLDLKALRRLIGIVTQETILFNDTVRNNIAYGLEGISSAAVIAAARAANAHEFIQGMPHGYDSVIGERGVKLSGGERQRLSLARAILKNPPILILDEATSSLDTESEILVQDAIERLMAGRTSVVIAHRLSTVQHADRIFVLDGGAIVEVGRHAELLANPTGVYKRLYELQFRL